MLVLRHLSMCSARAYAAVATAALVANSFAEHKGLATLRRRCDRRYGGRSYRLDADGRVGTPRGFVIGSLIGAVGGIVCMIGIVEADFWTFTVGNLVFGFFSGFAQLYRFAATDTASREFRGTAVSLVLAGGVVASVVGAEFAKLGHDMFAGASFLILLFLVAATPPERLG